MEESLRSEHLHPVVGVHSSHSSAMVHRGLRAELRLGCQPDILDSVDVRIGRWSWLLPGQESLRISFSPLDIEPLDDR